MNFQQILTLTLTLLGKKDELMNVVGDAMALFTKLKAIYPDIAKSLPQLSGGSTNQYTVQWLQTSLNKLVDAKLTVDGKYGAATHDAVKKFQTMSGLTVDGWAGVETTAAIINALK
jgi:peptidoglycan hydrolase-like protein with peptidoglycan-binding domain